MQKKLHLRFLRQQYATPKLFLLIVMLSFSLNLYALEKNVTLRAENATLREVFKSIREQSGLIFVYNEEEIAKKVKVSVNIKSTDIDVIMQSVLKGLPYQYEHSDGSVIVRPAERVSQKPQATEEIVLTGRVTDSKGAVIVGASVSVTKTTKGTVTNDKGEYSLKFVPQDGNTITISFLGMKTKVISYTGQRKIDASLEEDQKELDNVVVTGYQKIERRKLTSSIATVDMDNLMRTNPTSIDKALQGQVAGMTIMNTSGAPGAMPQIRVRGTSTISGNVQPLWVVDGIILEDPVNSSVDDIMTNRNLIASGIGGINIEDIESINVLKDAAATAIYGTRAANGVVVITSKKGTAGKTRISYSGTVSLSLRPTIEDAYMMNSKERIDVNLEMMRRGAFKANSNTSGEYGTVSDFERWYVDASDRKISWDQFEDHVRDLETINTDWFKYLFRNSLTHRHNMSISGGTEKTTFYVSGSFMDDQASAKDVGQQTYTGSIRVTTKPWTNLTVGASLDMDVRENKSFFAVDSWENPYEWAIYTTRAQRAFTPDGKYNYMYYNEMPYNYLENRETGWREARNVGLRGSINLEWRILKDLNFNTLFSFSKSDTKEEDIATENSYFVKTRKRDVYKMDGYTSVSVWEEGGFLKDAFTGSSSISFRNQLSYMPVVNHHHRFDIMVGQEVRKSKHDGTSVSVYGYAHNRGHQQLPQFELMKHIGGAYWSQALNESATVSWFGVAGYTMKNRYTVNFNARVDGSNRFGIKTNELFQPLWSAGFNYQLKEEELFANLDWLTYLTIRGSYGSQGNVASQAYSDIVARVGTQDGINKDGFLDIYAPKNPLLKWEKNYSSNIALEFGIYKRRLTAVVEYYNKKGVDLLGSKQVSQATGFSSIQVNWASMRNSGWECAINSINIDTPDFRWSTNLNFGFNKNEVLEVYSVPGVNQLTDAGRTNYSASAVVGKPINGLWSYRYAGLNESGRATFYNEKDKKVLSGMKNVAGLTYSGTTMPIIQSGFTNTFHYKKFTLSAMLIGSFGNVVRLRNLTDGNTCSFPDATKNMSGEWVNRWRNPGDEAITNIPVLEVNAWESSLTAASPYNGNMYDNSDLRTVKGDFIRLQSLSLSYDFYSEKMRNAGIQNISVSLQANNVHTWKDDQLKGQDPEAPGTSKRYTATNTATVRFGNTYLPLPRTFSMSVSIQF